MRTALYKMRAFAPRLRPLILDAVSLFTLNLKDWALLTCCPATPFRPLSETPRRRCAFCKPCMLINSVNWGSSGSHPIWDPLTLTL